VLNICVYKESDCTDNMDEIMNAHKYVISKTGGSWRLRRTFGA
jgi:hypothetical protein